MPCSSGLEPLYCAPILLALGLPLGTSHCQTGLVPAANTPIPKSASKSGTTVTKTLGPVFDTSDVDKIIYWADGTQDKITAFLNNNQVSVLVSGTKSSQIIGGVNNILTKNNYSAIIGGSGNTMASSISAANGKGNYN